MTMTTLWGLLLLAVMCSIFAVHPCCAEEGSGDDDFLTTIVFETSSMMVEVLDEGTTIVTELVTDIVSSSASPVTYAASDIKADGLTVTSPSGLIYDLDVDNIITTSVTIKNAGGTAITAASSGDNFALQFAVSSLADPTDASAELLMFSAEDSSATNLDSAIAAGSSVTIAGVNAMINIPSGDTCDSYNYLCVIISKASGVDYVDSDTTNNYYCVAFGETSEGYAGVLTCSGCAVKMSLLFLMVCAFVTKLLS